MSLVTIIWGLWVERDTPSFRLELVIYSLISCDFTTLQAFGEYIINTIYNNRFKSLILNQKYWLILFKPMNWPALWYPRRISGIMNRVKNNNYDRSQPQKKRRWVHLGIGCVNTTTKNPPNSSRVSPLRGSTYRRTLRGLLMAVSPWCRIQSFEKPQVVLK